MSKNAAGRFENSADFDQDTAEEMSMMADLVRRSTLERNWNSWAGEVQDLQRVASLVEDLAVRRRSQILAELTEDDDKYERARWEKQEELVKMEAADSADSITGFPDSVFKELDRRTVRKIKIFTDLPGYEEKVEVSFDKKGHQPGVRLEIKSLDPGWARQARAQLSDEIEKSVPKWSFFLSTPGLALSLLMSYITVVGVASLMEARFVHHDLAGAIGNTFAVTFALSWAILLLGAVIWPWMFPRFEIYGKGGSSTGGRRIVGLLVFLGSIASGVIVNLIT